MNADTFAKLLNRYTSRGGNAVEGERLLTELITSHDGNRLELALVYWHFATPAQASKIVGG